MKKQCGFTLIEVMIIVVIIAILSAVAIPAYMDYAAKEDCSNGSISACERVSKQRNRNIRQQNYGQQQVQTDSVGCVAGYKVLPNGNQLLNERGGGISCNQ